MKFILLPRSLENWEAVEENSCTSSEGNLWHFSVHTSMWNIELGSQFTCFVVIIYLFVTVLQIFNTVLLTIWLFLWLWVRSFWSVTLVRMKMNWMLRPVWPISGFIFNFSSPLHVSAPSGHPQKECGRLLVYHHHPVMTSPIPHVLLLYMWDTGYLTLVRHNTLCIIVICLSENLMLCSWQSNLIIISYDSLKICKALN
jgi:hypothetical protein